MKGSKSYLKIRKTLSILFYSIIIGSCGYVDHEKKLISAFEQAGANKQEQLKVIEHYKRKHTDDLDDRVNS